MNLKSRLAELEVKVLSEDLSNNTIGFKESIDAVVINEVNLSSISSTSIALYCISQIASSDDVNHNHSMGADNLSPDISQPVVIINVVFPNGKSGIPIDFIDAFRDADRRIYL